MPPRQCLQSFPRCALDSALPRRPITASRSHPFSTSSHYNAKAPPQGSTLRLKKKGRPTATAKPPEPGERRAIRKRIVLSNTNALDRPEVETLSVESKIERDAKVYKLPNEIIDQLRAVEAFKTKQGWAFFHSPSVLMRKDGEDLRQLMDAQKSGGDASSQATRRVIYGDKGAGKSVLLLQAMAMAFQRGWVVINLPEARDLVIGHTAFQPIATEGKLLYAQSTYTSKLLEQILAANEKVLSKITVAEKPQVPFPIRDNLTLAELLKIGVNEEERAWPIFEAFWKDLTRANPSAEAESKDAKRPPVLLCLDNLAYAMKESKYQVLDENNKMKPVHAHDLTLVKHFMDHLSGKAKMPNGGMVLAATSASDAPKSEAMEVGIARQQARQNQKDAESASTTIPYPTAFSRMQIVSPDQVSDPTALSNFWSPFKAIDQRLLDALDTVHVTHVEGVQHKEATTIMKHWAQSGMYRDMVVPWKVDEARALSGGGIIGQLEHAAVRFIRREPVRPERDTAGAKIRQH